MGKIGMVNSAYLQLINVKKTNIGRTMEKKGKLKRRQWLKRTRWNFIMHIWNQLLNATVILFCVVLFCAFSFPLSVSLSVTFVAESVRNKHFTILVIKRFHWMNSSTNGTRYVHVNLTWLDWCSSCIHVNDEGDQDENHEMRWDKMTTVRLKED